MRVVATSDLHGYLPGIAGSAAIPPCDLLLIAGDVTPVANHAIPFQRWWLREHFAPWIRDLEDRGVAEEVVWIAGNHDLAFGQGPLDQDVLEAGTYLQDGGTSFRGLKIWGTPWSQIIGPWAFSLEEASPARRRGGTGPHHDLEAMWELIPDDADIVLCHGPPRGHLDRCIDGENAGSPSLLRRLEEVEPMLTVFGHIHEAYGSETAPWGGELVNASRCDHRYQPVNPPVLIASEEPSADLEQVEID